MSQLTVQNGSRVSNTSAQVVYDAGESLKRAIQSVVTNDTNGNIESMKSQLQATLRQHGIKNTDFVGQLLYHFRGVKQGVPGDLKKFMQAVQTARSAGALGPKGADSLRDMVGEASQRQISQSRVANSPLNVKNQQQAPRSNSAGSGFDIPKLKRVDLVGESIIQKAQNKPAAQKPAQTKQAPQPKLEKKAEVSPALEHTITGIDIAAKSMPEGLLKSGLEAVHSALEAVKGAQEGGDKQAYARAALEVSSKTLALTRQIVKTFGQDPALARLAGMQVGKLAWMLGDKIAAPLKSIDNFSRLFTGKTLDGTPVDNNKRADAFYDLVSGPLSGPVQAAMVISKLELQAVYNQVGVPVQRAIETAGLNRFFGGKTPEQMRTDIEKLPTDEANAMATALKLFHIFPAASAFGGAANARDLWHLKLPPMKNWESFRTMHNKTGFVPETLQEETAKEMKQRALAFLDDQVREARGKW